MKTLKDEVTDFFLNEKIINSNGLNSIINKPNLFIDEALFLFERFFKRFEIDKGYINLDDFFNPLPALNLRYIFNHLILRRKLRLEQKKIITLEHMIKVAEKKEWFNPL